MTHFAAYYPNICQSVYTVHESPRFHRSNVVLTEMEDILCHFPTNITLHCAILGGANNPPSRSLISLQYEKEHHLLLHFLRASIKSGAQFPQSLKIYSSCRGFIEDISWLHYSRSGLQQVRAILYHRIVRKLAHVFFFIAVLSIEVCLKPARK